MNSGVTRLVALSLLLSAWMMTLSLPAVDLVFHRGHFNQTDAILTAHYFALFAASLPFWSAQALYARAFYAAGNMRTPMIGSTVVLLLSLPVYALLFRWYGVPGLAVASDLGIAVNTIVLAVLLHRSTLARLGGVEWPELGRALLAAGIAGLATGFWVHMAHRALGSYRYTLVDAVELLLGSVLWLVVSWAVLWLTGSSLPRQITSRLRRRNALHA